MFRPFNMNTMDNVSILFADIVGFTRWPNCSSQWKFKHDGYDCHQHDNHRMSSNKTASQLVGLLNDLFGRWWRSSIFFACVHFSCCGVTHHHRRFLYFCHPNNYDHCHPHPKHPNHDNQVWPNVSHVPLREDLHPRRLLLLCLRLSWATVMGMTMMRLWQGWWWWLGCLKITIMNIFIMVGMVILYYNDKWWLSLSGLTTPPTA